MALKKDPKKGKRTVETVPKNKAFESIVPTPAIESFDEETESTIDSDDQDFKTSKRLRLKSKSLGDAAATSILAQKGQDRFRFLNSRKKFGLALKNLNKKEIDNIHGPMIRRLRQKKNLLDCVLVKKKYNKDSPFVPVYVPGVLKIASVPTAFCEEGMGFDQYAKIEVPENEDEKASAGYERYFEQTYNGGKTPITSDNTLAQLRALETRDIMHGLDQAKAKLANAIKWLAKLNSALFPQWRFELDQGYNLLFYGYGSKKATLEKFAQEFLQCSTSSLGTRSRVVVINGYYPDLTIRSVISTIVRDGIGLDTCNTSKLMESVAAIRSHFEIDRNHRLIDRLYILVHNLDGENLRSMPAQQMFAGLGSIPKISVVASVDNIRSSLLWDQAHLSQMNFLSHELVTYSPYEAETSFESSPLFPMGAHPGGQISIRSVTHVLASLNDKAKGIFKLLLQAQVISEDSSKKDLSKEKEPQEPSKPSFAPFFQNQEASCLKSNNNDSELGLSFDHLFGLSRQKFLTSNHTTFQASLREFLDHGLIKETKSSGSIRYHVPAPIHSLKAILELSELAELK